MRPENVIDILARTKNKLDILAENVSSEIYKIARGEAEEDKFRLIRNKNYLCYNPLLSRIGNTPLLRLNRISKDLKNIDIYAKAEWFNPGGSVKDRAGYLMVQEAIRKSKLKEGITLLESSSGNTGIALAMIGAFLGFKVTLVVPENMSLERKKILRAYDAEIIFTDPLEGSEGSRKIAEEIANNDKKYFYIDQYNNPDNLLAHYLTTGQEIIEQTQGKVTHFIAGAGTGGTIMGTGKRLKEFNPNIKIYAVQPDNPTHVLEGLKHMKTVVVPSIYKEEELDGVIEVSTEESLELIKRLAKEEGYFAGFSSGAALAGSLKLAKTIDKGFIVTVFPDGGEKYLSSGLWGSDL